ncbi:uncharacterized protein LOC116182858 isoform X2 [Photinus pyralis]|uniref:uncharacterized protein LOC116182858 isoform X2 n=1 Tax=Photinus pyralis TaxID=7054 RepID=UPI0012676F1F|nr:uncharacterized protein LOC116182858 isoform X2 [Photinus pyralis]
MGSVSDVPVTTRKLKPDLLQHAKGKFVVAEFLPFKEIESMTIEAIPGYWLQESTTCFICPATEKNGDVKKIVQSYIFAYIPPTSTHHIRKAKMENSLPDPETWVKWPINFVLDTIFETYLEARQEEVKAEAYPFSDLDNYIVQGKYKERRTKIHKKKWPSDSTTAYETDSDLEEGLGTTNTSVVLNKRGTMNSQKQKVFKKKPLETHNIPSPPAYVQEEYRNVVQPTISTANENDVPTANLEETLWSESVSDQAHNHEHIRNVRIPLCNPTVPQSDQCKTIVIDSHRDSHDGGTMTNGKHDALSENSGSIEFSSPCILVETDVNQDQLTEITLNEIEDAAVTATPHQNTPLIPPGVPVGVEIDLENMDLFHNATGDNKDEFNKACFLRLLDLTVENRNRLIKLENLLESINAKLDVKCTIEGNHQDWAKMKDLVPLPINTMEELEHLNNTLKKNSTYFKYLQSYMMDSCPIPNIQNLDSKTVKQELHKVVGHILCRIMTNELAVGLNMCGRHLNANTPKKEGLKKYPELLMVTFEAMKPKAKLSNLELDRAQSEAAIGEWLRQAKTRMGESKELKRKKMAEKRAAENNK